MTSGCLPQDRFQMIPSDVAIPDSDHPKASGFEHLSASCVIHGLVSLMVRVAFELHDDPLHDAVEVHDEAVQHVLATEFQTEDATVS